MIYNGMRKYFLLSFILLSAFICVQNELPVKVGAEVTDAYFPLLKGKRVAVMTNQTGKGCTVIPNSGDPHSHSLLATCLAQKTRLYST